MRGFEQALPLSRLPLTSQVLPRFRDYAAVAANWLHSGKALFRIVFKKFVQDRFNFLQKLPCKLVHIYDLQALRAVETSFKGTKSLVLPHKCFHTSAFVA